MKTTILALSDIHTRFAKFPATTMPDADFVLIAGDFTDWGVREPGHALAAERWINALAERYRWVYYVLGNHDLGFPDDVFENTAARLLRPLPTEPKPPDGYVPPPWILSLEGRVVGHCVEQKDAGGNVESQSFLMTGINFSPCFGQDTVQATYRNMTARPENDAAVFAALCSVADIVVSHCPPYGCLDYRGRIITTGEAIHDGSPGLRYYIEQCQPKLVVCGHVHSCVGMERIGETVVINTAQSATLITIGDAGEIDAEIVG